ncbi:MAG: hypothetical protein ACYC1U_04545 [Candidatus Aquicultorales bacterium]
MLALGKRAVLVVCALALVMTLGASFSTQATIPQLSGAVFTTTADGSLVNGSIYNDRNDVYLDGGPGPHAPASASGLPTGWYYYQVTDPAGKVLLSKDRVTDRSFFVNSHGVISSIGGSPHMTGTDLDHGDLGAITVQLMPYKPTPNKGGVYKVWVTPVGDYVAGGGVFGFVPARSKTDNFKVKGKLGYEDPLTVRKFDDSNANGIWDAGETELNWLVDISGPNYSNTLATPFEIIADPAGDWTVAERLQDGWKQTAVFVDGVAAVPPTLSITIGVAGLPSEHHTVVFGNIQLGDVTARKFYDRDADGVKDASEPFLPGWKMRLEGTDVRGETITPVEAFTDVQGEAVFADLLPGSYRVTEVLPNDAGWQPSTPVTLSVVLAEGGHESVLFGNSYQGTASFGTKGYWHNQNGIARVTQDDIDAINLLDPYMGATEYWATPFDGSWQPTNYSYFGIGAWGEISDYLTAPVSVSPYRFQLSQQLLVFVLNLRHELPDDGYVQLPDDTWTSGSSIIDEAISSWVNGANAPGTEMIGLLDWFNNSTSVKYIPYTPPPVSY